MPLTVPKITITKVRKALVTDGWRLDHHNHAYVNRHTSVLGGAVSFTEQKHTGTKKVTVRVTWYTGIEGHRRRPRHRQGAWRRASP